MSDYSSAEELPRFAELEAEYEVLRELGRGGTAVVYLARDRELDRLVAVKVIRATYVEDEEASARLVREAHVVGGMQHPNIVMLYGTRRLGDGSLALIMQYVEGRTLKDELRASAPLAYDRVTTILAELASALAYAHDRRIVHRDIKPENIYLDDTTGIARLSDFGIARSFDAAASGLTLPGSALGTPTYMSPEQIDGGELDGRSDVYSLGLVGWEMIAGHAPWQGESLFGIIYRQKHEMLPPLDARRDDVPLALQRAIEGALQKDPSDRWPGAREFRAALVGQSRLPGARRSGRSTPVRPDRPVPALPDAPTIRFRPGDLPDLVADEPSTIPAPAASASGHPPVERRPRRAAAVAVAVLLVTAAAATLSMTWMSVDAKAVGEDARAVVPASELHDGAPTFQVPDLTVDAVPIVNDPEPTPAEVSARDSLETAVATALGPDGSSEPESAPSPVRVAAATPLAISALEGDTVELVITATDSQGRPVAEALARFRIGAGGGELLGSRDVLTDQDGRATVRWRLGSQSEQRTVAQVIDADAPITFTASVGRAPLGVRTGIHAGGTHTCRLSGDGSLACWGANDRGQLGAASATARSTIGYPEPFARATAGIAHSCAITRAGRAVCWGSNSDGQLGVSSAGSPLSGVPLPTRVSAIAAGGAHTCALGEDGAIYCWGSNTHGQLGDGSRSSRGGPVRIAGERQFRAIAAGWTHTCAITTDAMLWCWGRNNSGQLGLEDTSDRLVPALVRGGHEFTAVAAGSGHTCALRLDGTAMCWGSNEYGQLGNATSQSASVPEPVTGASPFIALAAGGVHTCALTRDGIARCWGRNVYGQLGDGTTSDRTVPVDVAGDHRFRTLSASGAHTCGVATDGTQLCWGYNIEGQLGAGSRVNQHRPVVVVGGR